VRHYPRWQLAVTDRLATFAVRQGGMDLERSRQWQWRLARALGQPLSPARWDAMNFNDKILYRKLRVRDDRYRVCSDKVVAREYVAARVGTDVLPRVLAVLTSAPELDSLVGPFSLKSAHGSGMLLHVPEVRRLTEDERHVASTWFDEDFGFWSREEPYQGLPRRLIVEELLSWPSPVDYKFFVFDGVPRAVEVDERRYQAHERSIMSMEWEVLGGCRVPLPATVPARPAHFDALVDLASRLGDGFDHVRVDLYDLEDRVVFGELTVFHGGGASLWFPDRLNELLGSFWTTIPHREGAAPGSTGG
jgi:hypothetical protein